MTVQQPPTTVPAAFVINTAISGAISLEHWIGGQVVVPSAWTAANMGFKVSDSATGTFTILKDDVGTPVQISNITTNASYAYSLPTELFKSRYIKLWSKSATAGTVTDVNQAAARSLSVYLK